VVAHARVDERKVKDPGYYRRQYEKSNASPPRPVREMDANQVWKNRGKLQIVDVRPPDERRGELGFIEGSISIPIDRLEQGLDRLDRGHSTVVVCKKGVRSACGADILNKHGFSNVWSMRAGMEDWNRRKLPVRH
jgi:rhodanese-related sulfurtransferase